MEETDVDAILESFKRPCCKMISATLMGALIGSGVNQQDANKRMESILPLLGKHSKELSSPLNSMFSVNLIVWCMPENIRSGFFADDDLSLNGLVKVVQDGANEWHRVCSDKGISEKTIVPLFFALKEILAELFDKKINKKSMASQFIKLQDNLIESFDWE